MGSKSTVPLKPPVAVSFASAARAATAAGVAAVPVVGVFAPLALAPLMVTAAVFGVVHLRVRGRGWPLPPHPFMALLAAIIVWSTASLVWSIDPQLSAAKLWRHAANLMAGLALVGVAMRLPRDEAQRLSLWYLYGLVAAAFCLAFVRGALVPVGAMFPIDGGIQVPLNPYNRGATVVAVLVWPAALYAARFGRWPAITLVIGTCLLLATYASQAALFSILAGMAAAGFVALRRLLAAAVGAVIAIAVLAMPLFPATLPPPAELRSAYHLPGSHYHRLLIWQFAAERIAERPYLGWGLESSKVIPGNKSLPDGAEPALPLHPHNGALQIWLELGALGALLAAGLALHIGTLIRRLPRAAAIAAAGCFASATSVSLLSYGMWQSWWLATLFIGGSLVILAHRSAGDRAA